MSLLVDLVNENEHKVILNWYEEKLDRDEDVKLVADNHLEGRLDAVSSVEGTFPSMQEGSPILQIYSKSVVTSSLKSSGKIAKAFAAELKGKQLKEEIEKRKQELERQLQVEKDVAVLRKWLKQQNSRLKKGEKGRKHWINGRDAGKGRQQSREPVKLTTRL